MNSRTMISSPPSQAERQSAKSTRAPALASGAAPIKPRLKLTSNGQLLLIEAGVSGLSTHEIKTRIRRGYGSMRAFADQFDLHYPSVICALSLRAAHLCAGKTAEMRMLFGLSSTPSQRSISLAAAWAKKPTRKAAPKQTSTGVSA